MRPFPFLQQTKDHIYRSEKIALFEQCILLSGNSTEELNIGGNPQSDTLLEFKITLQGARTYSSHQSVCVMLLFFFFEQQN